MLVSPPPRAWTVRPWRRRGARALAMLVALAALGSAGCGGDGSIRVFAASSLQDVLPRLLDAYAEANDGVDIEVQYGGSQALATQLELGAEADLFVSANEQQLQRLEDADLIARRAAVATNRLVIAVASDSAIGSLDDLGASGLRIAIGAPEVPVGSLTEQLFAGIDPALATEIRANVITEDPNVRIALSRVELGEADAAFVYGTDVLAGDDLRAIELPINVEPNIYLGGVLRGAHPSTESLLAFLAGHEAVSIWQASGFEPLNTPVETR